MTIKHDCFYQILFFLVLNLVLFRIQWKQLKLMEVTKHLVRLNEPIQIDTEIILKAQSFLNKVDVFDWNYLLYFVCAFTRNICLQ